MSLHTHVSVADLKSAVLTQEAGGNRIGAARARFALGRALLAASEPAGREMV